ncbi:MAG: hypothetical protein ACRDAU_05725 [Clostridium sp.]
MKIINTIKFELSSIVKMKLTYLILCLSLIYNSFIYMQMLKESNSLDFIRSTTYCAQALVFIFIILGIYMCKKEEAGNMIEILKGINSGIFTKYVSKILTIGIIIGCFTIINYFLIEVLFKSEYTHYKTDILTYLFIYWVCALVIGTLIGFIIGNIFKGKSVYIVSILIWFLITPINDILFTQLGVLGVDSAFEISDFLNICQDNIYNPINETYGLGIENYQIYQRLFIILTLVSLMIFLFYKKKFQTKRNFIISQVILGTLILLTGFKTFENQQVMTYEHEKNAFSREDGLDYSGIISKKEYSKNFKAINYNINLDINQNLKGNVNIKLQNISNENPKQIHFLLYHKLNVDNVLVHGESVDFEQDFDNLNIFLKKEIQKNDFIEVEVQYGGNTATKNFANSRAIYLTNSYPYIPILSEFNSIMSDGSLDSSIYRHNIQIDEGVEYSLEINNDADVHTNLERIDSNKFKGVSDGGFYLVKGIQINEKIDSVDVFYPTKIENEKDLIKDRTNNINKAISLINDTFNLDIKLNKLMIIDTTYIGSETFPSNKGFYEDGTLVISLRDFERNEFWTSLASSITWRTHNIDDSNFQTLRIFDFATGMYLENQIVGHIENNEFEMYLYNLNMNKEFLENENNPLIASIESTQKIYDLINNKTINTNIKIKFLQEWYNEITNNKVKDIKEIANRIR